jgi:eukaryotic-like serine/threonine-protein kinase
MIQDGKVARPVLEQAARSIALVSGVAETVIDLVHGRAFRHYAEGLRQYIAIRIGNAVAARAVVRELRAVASATGASELVKPPGVRARLYAIARQLATQHAPKEERSRHMTWRAQANPDRGRTLSAIREALDLDDAELVELRYARELSPDEVAFVVGRPQAEIEQRLADAVRSARELHHDQPNWHLTDALVETFALEPDDPEEVPVEEEAAGLMAGTVIGNRYRIQKRMGSGSFADVYRASDTGVPGHVIALKLLHQPSLSEEAKEAALRELRLIASVFHPSIVQFKDHGWFEGRLWFVMPWYEGEALEQRIHREPLGRKEARGVFEHLARALASMHAAGVRHQDIKPDNIFLARLKHLGLDAEGGVLPVLLDLGVAAKEAEMVVAGTPTYFAPEVAAQFAPVPKEHEIGSKADMFSFALSLRNALEPETQEVVAAGAVEHFIERRATEPVDLFSKPDLKYLNKTFTRWLALDPAERPTADEMVTELAVLTEPEDKRKRFIAVARWLGPMLLALAATFGAVVYALVNEAAKRADEARDYRTRAELTQAELDEEEQARQAAEADVEQIREQYESSQLTRRDLVAKVADTESRLRSTRERLSNEQGRSRVLRERLEGSQERAAELQENLTTTQGTLTQTRNDLGQTRVDLAAARSQATQLEGELRTARADLDAAHRRASELDGTVRGLEAQMAATRAENQTLAQRVSQAESQRAQAERSVAEARARIAELERQLAEARRNPAPTPTPPNPNMASAENPPPNDRIVVDVAMR